MIRKRYLWFVVTPEQTYTFFTEREARTLLRGHKEYLLIAHAIDSRETWAMLRSWALRGNIGNDQPTI